MFTYPICPTDFQLYISLISLIGLAARSSLVYLIIDIVFPQLPCSIE